MNFFKKKTKFYISVDANDLKSKPEDLAQVFLELEREITKEEILVLSFSELNDLSLSILSTVISFIVLVENSHTLKISIQAGTDLQRKFKEANLVSIISKLAPN